MLTDRYEKHRSLAQSLLRNPTMFCTSITSRWKPRNRRRFGWEIMALERKPISVEHSPAPAIRFLLPSPAELLGHLRSMVGCSERNISLQKNVVSKLGTVESFFSGILKCSQELSAQQMLLLELRSLPLVLKGIASV
jgi:hypothetical protein